MGLQATLLLYAMIGAGVATATSARQHREVQDRWFETLTAGLFWPLYVPQLLMSVDTAEFSNADGIERIKPHSDDLNAAITQAEAELDAALMSLDGWAEQTLSSELDRLDELKLAWRHQAARVRELSQLLDQAHATVGPLTVDVDRELTREECASGSESARRANLQRLDDVRLNMRNELLGTIDWVRELVTLIHLARYTGAPASRAAELVSQIAATVEGLREVSELQAEEVSV